jgi:transcriptional regulator with XRE-family HTH domain
MLKITLAAARVNAGFTQKEVADMLDVSNKTICNWENGKSFPSPKQIDMLCELYSISYDNIIFLPSNSL